MGKIISVYPTVPKLVGTIDGWSYSSCHSPILFYMFDFCKSHSAIVPITLAMIVYLSLSSSKIHIHT
jgi:hypothetical protein